MGLREKAQEYKRSASTDLIENLDKIYEGHSLSRSELIQLKNEIKNRLEFASGQLDRKLLDVQTLFEIGKELTSILQLSDLIQILLFTLLGQFRISDVAVFIHSSGQFDLLDKKGFSKLTSFPADPDLTRILSTKEKTLSGAELTAYQSLENIITSTGIKLIAPMKNKDKFIGFIALGGKSTREGYDEEERSFAYTLASLAGIAIDNARLYEEITRANRELDKKYGELSTLYDISKVINSSDDFEAVLSLIMETITTGFGVRQAILFISENAEYRIKKTVGFEASGSGKTLVLTEAEENLLTGNKTEVIKDGSRLSSLGIQGDSYLFIPLYSIGTKIGGIIVSAFENYTISPDNVELLSLFSIIASQAAPPAAMTLMLREGKSKAQDAFTPVIATMEKEIQKARQFDVSVVFAMLKLTGFNKFVEFYGGESTHQMMEHLIQGLSAKLPAAVKVIRYSSSRILFIMPGLFESDIEDIKNSIYDQVRVIFKNENQMEIGADILLVNYPDSGEDKFSLLNLIE